MNIKPSKIQVVCDDGSVREAAIDSISDAIKQELAGMGLIPTPENETQKSVLIEWNDGWKEVYAAPGDVVDIRKYYVVSRTEDVGRLFLEKGKGYPELVEVRRKPFEIKKVSLI